MVNIDKFILYLSVAVIALALLKTLPIFIAKFGFSKYIREHELFYIHTAIFIFTIVLLAVAIGEQIGNVLLSLPSFITSFFI